MAFTVLVVDDHPAVLDSVTRLLSEQPDLEVVGQATGLDEATAAIDRLAPSLDLVVCDIQMGGEADGLRLLERHGRSGRPRFLILSAFDYPTLMRAAFERGARGYLLKTTALPEIAHTVLRVARGEEVFSALALRTIGSALPRPSAREIEVLELLLAGARNEEIARGLVLSLKTVESHLRRLFNRYGLMNRTELAVLALREGWVERPAARG
jgi:DNA-binding NarL/FixJ family response regulator